MSALCSRHQDKGSKAFVVQIGANDGRISDPIYEQMLRFRSSTRILLIEPQDDVIPYLRENYSFHSDATIWNGAIGPDDTIALYRLKPQYYQDFIRRYLEGSPSYRVPTGFTSSDYDHVLQHTTGNLPSGITAEQAIELITRPSATLAKVIAEVGLAGDKIDILQIDTEGMDDEVIYASNIDTLQPILINFEHKHLSRDRMLRLMNSLQALGYIILKYGGSDALAVSEVRLSSYGIRLKRDPLP